MVSRFAKILLGVIFLYSFQGFASILPPNDLHLEDDINSRDANIDEVVFNEIIDAIEAVYGPLIADVHNKELVVNRKWTSSTVNASANRSGNKWIVNMYGGLARRPETTPDGFALVVCHELGHHLGGFPKKGFIFAGWAASEGQSDYYASHSCARMIWGSDDNSAFEFEVEPTAKDLCDQAWFTAEDQQLCYRTAMAGKSLAVLLGSLQGSTNIEFDTPSTKEVGSTSTSHPKAQCRLDTYTAGALCDVEFDVNTIPKNEKEASETSCMRTAGYELEARPRCWFAPKL